MTARVPFQSHARTRYGPTPLGSTQQPRLLIFLLAMAAEKKNVTITRQCPLKLRRTLVLEELLHLPLSR